VFLLVVLPISGFFFFFFFMFQHVTKFIYSLDYSSTVGLLK